VIIIVSGTPAPQGSKVFYRKGGMRESSKAVGPWREAVRTETQGAMIKANMPPLTGPVRVNLQFVMPRPKGHYRTGRNAHLLRDGAPPWPVGKPDADKLARAVFDGLTDGGAWKDDSQVVALHVVKTYAATSGRMIGLAAGCKIVVNEVGETEGVDAVRRSNEGW
jgi:Holliday junction resolvase RusA-like endonuclease